MRIVFDLDGTLADVEQRIHFIDRHPKDWDGFYNACDKDAPIYQALWTLHALSHAPGKGHAIEIWSGRGEGKDGIVRLKTLAWLRGETGLLMPCVRYQDAAPSAYFHKPLRLGVALRMRRHGDHTLDFKLKLQWLNQARIEHREPDLVFEDRQRVVDMWRDEGIRCFHVMPGDF